MKPQSALLTLCLALLVPISTARAQPELIQNGEFETPPSAYIVVVMAGQEPANFGWTVESGSVDVFKAGMYVSSPLQSGQSLELNGSSVGTIAQTFATQPQTQYTLTFIYTNNAAFTGPGNPATADIEIVDALGTPGSNVLASDSISHATATATDADWTQHTLTFTAVSSQTTLRFVSTTFITPPFGGIVIDAVSVKLASGVPPPPPPPPPPVPGGGGVPVSGTGGAEGAYWNTHGPTGSEGGCNTEGAYLIVGSSRPRLHGPFALDGRHALVYRMPPPRLTAVPAANTSADAAALLLASATLLLAGAGAAYGHLRRA